MVTAGAFSELAVVVALLNDISCLEQVEGLESSRVLFKVWGVACVIVGVLEVGSAACTP